MERIVHRQLVKALENHNLISNCQFGFCSNHSTVSLLLQVVHDWAGSLIVLELAKAFDSVSHPCLLLMLEALEITNDILA